MFFDTKVTLNFYPGRPKIADTFRSDLGQYVPCGGKVDLDFRAAYSRTELTKSIFELEARASDGANHVASETISFWLDRSKIKMKVTSETTFENLTVINRDPVKFFGSKASDFALLLPVIDNGDKKYKSILKIFSNGKSTQYLKFSEEFQNLVQIVNDPSGNIYVIWASKKDESTSDTYLGCIATEVKDTQLQKIPSVTLDVCGSMSFWSDSKRGLWHTLPFTDDSQEIVKYSNDQIYKFSFKENTMDENCTISWASIVNDQLYFFCDAVYITPVESINPKRVFDLDLSMEDFKLEGKDGKMWFVSRELEKKSGYALNGIFYDLTSEIAGALSGQDKISRVNGEVVINGKIWNNQNLAFVDVRPEIRKNNNAENIYFSEDSFPISCNSKGATVFSPEGAVFWPLAELLSDRSEWPIACKNLRTQDLKSISVISKTASLIEFRNESWIRLGETQYPYEGRAPIAYVNQFNNLLTVLHTDGEILQLQNNKWAPLKRTFPQELDLSQFYITYILNNQYLAILQGTMLFLSRDGISWETAVQNLSLFHMVMPYYIQSASDGKVFFVVDLNKIYSWQNGKLNLEYEIDSIAQTSISECRGDVWMITNTRIAQGKKITISKYNQTLKINQNFEINGSFKEGALAMRMQCLDDNRILIKMNEPGSSEVKDYVYSTTDGTGRFLVNKQGNTFLTDFYWKDTAKVFVREDKVYDYDFNEIDSSALAGFNSNVTEYFHMAYRDGWDRIWYYSANSIGLIDLDR